MMIDTMVKMFSYSRKRGLDGAKAKCSEHTIKLYEKHLKTFSTWLMNEEAVTLYENVNRNHIRRFVEFLEGKKSKGEWADATFLQALRTLRTFFNWVGRDADCLEEKLEQRQLQKCLPVIPSSKPRDDIPSNAHLKKFRQSFDTDTVCGFRDFVLSTVMASVGIRAGEACNLTLDSLHLTDFPPYMIVDGKTGQRPVPLTKELVRLLKAWIKRRVALSPAAGSPYVFVSRVKPQLNSTVIGKAFRRNRAKNELPRISPHTFRHAFCTTYLKRGGGLDKLKTITGHKTYQMLDAYVKKAAAVSMSANEELERLDILKDC